MRVLRGALRETVFRFPDEALLRCGRPAPPTVERRRVLREGEVGYISSTFPSFVVFYEVSSGERGMLIRGTDSIGLHSMQNVDPEGFAVSLHCEWSDCDGFADIRSVHAAGEDMPDIRPGDGPVQCAEAVRE
jgi:hypothetical protein